MTKRLYNRAGMALWAAMIALASVLVPYAAQPARAEINAPIPEPSDEIVYIDAEGFIRVIDMRYDGVPQITWVSQFGSWDEVALGDVNNDGDKEIIAIRGDGTEAKPGILAIFDPVLSGGIPDGKINGIPWGKLWQVDLGYKPILIAAGNFDAGVPGDQIIVGGMSTDPKDSKKIYKMTVYKQTSATPDGRDWQIHQERWFEEVWTRWSAGDMVPGGTDELAVVAEQSDLASSGKFSLFQLDNNWARLWDFGDRARPANDVAFGQWTGSASEELAVTRAPNLGQTSLFIGEWNVEDAELVEGTAVVYDPAARRLAFGNTNAANNDELFLMRTVPAGTGLARLFNMKRGGDENSVHTWNEALSDDNEWRAMVMGDTDGDGRAELVIGRRDFIRVYTNPSNGPEEKVDFPVTFNRRSLVIGDLDKNGFVEGPQFEVSKRTVEATTTAGSAVSDSFTIRNVATAEAVPFTIVAQDNPAWLRVQPSSGSVPANGVAQTISLTFDATNLEPGVYRSRLTVDSTADVNNLPIDIVITFMVDPAPLRATPGSLFVSVPISPTESTTQTRTIQLSGTSGMRFTAAILATPNVAAAVEALGSEIVASEVTVSGGLRVLNEAGVSVDFAMPEVVQAAGASEIVWPSGVPWATVTSNTSTVPATMTIVFDPALMEGDFNEAMLFLYPDESAGIPPDSLRLIPLYIMETSSVNFVPSVSR